MLDFVPITTITISSMIVPFTVWILATFLLREVFRKSYIKYSILSLIGFIIVNASKLSNGQWSFGYIKYLLLYIMLVSVGQITSRYYCRKRDHALQAVLAEIFIFFIYGSCFLIVRGTFSIDLLKSPFVIIVALCSFVRNVLIVNGVRHASSVVALEFCGFSKPIFSFIFRTHVKLGLIISFILIMVCTILIFLNQSPSINKDRFSSNIIEAKKM